MDSITFVMIALTLVGFALGIIVTVMLTKVVDNVDYKEKRETKKNKFKAQQSIKDIKVTR